jgi:hypothetical protein
LEGVGVVNMRRTVRFRKNCEPVHFVPKGAKWPGESIEDADAGGNWRPELKMPPIDVIASKLICCIADSVLRANERLQSLYHIVERDFASAYGEKPPLIGTSYKHIRFQGGGLCAQACCFTTAAMMQQFLPEEPSDNFQPGVHGIAEITAIAARKSQAELHQTGLTFDRISTYLENIGLSAPRQTLHGYHLIGAPNASKRHAELFESALRAYAISGFPVVVPTVMRLLPWHRASEGSETALNHAVVIVGCGRAGTAAARRLLVNDPAYMPFVPADHADIASAASPDPVKEPATIVAAVPREVVLPLWPATRLGDTVAGLFDIARFLQTLEGADETAQLCRSEFRTKPHHWTPGEFQLIRFGKAFDPFGPLSLRIVPPRGVWRIIDQTIATKLSGWHWVQYRPGPSGWSYAIWNAQSGGRNSHRRSRQAAGCAGARCACSHF